MNIIEKQEYKCTQPIELFFDKYVGHSIFVDIILLMCKPFLSNEYSKRISSLPSALVSIVRPSIVDTKESEVPGSLSFFPSSCWLSNFDNNFSAVSRTHAAMVSLTTFSNIINSAFSMLQTNCGIGLD